MLDLNKEDIPGTVGSQWIIAAWASLDASVGVNTLLFPAVSAVLAEGAVLLAEDAVLVAEGAELLEGAELAGLGLSLEETGRDWLAIFRETM